MRALCCAELYSKKPSPPPKQPNAILPRFCCFVLSQVPYSSTVFLILFSSKSSFYRINLTVAYIFYVRLCCFVPFKWHSKSRGSAFNKNILQKIQTNAPRTTFDM